MSDWAHRTEFRLSYDDEAAARIVTQSLREEVGEIDDDRSATSLSRTDGTVVLQIQATDLVALRAAMNTWLSLVTVAERTVSITTPFGDLE